MKFSCFCFTFVCLEAFCVLGQGSDGNSDSDMQGALQRCNMLLRPLTEGAKELQGKLSNCELNLGKVNASYEAFVEGTKLDKNELEALRSRVKEIENKHSGSHMTKERLLRNITSLVKLGKTLHAQNKNLKVEIENALSLLEYEKSYSADLNETIKNKENEIQALRQRVAALEGGKVKQENNKLQKAMESMQSEITSMKSSSDEQQIKLTFVQSQLASKEQAYLALESRMDTEDKELETAKEEVTTLKQELEDSNEKYQKTASALVLANSDLDRMKSKMENLLKERSSFEGRVSELSEKQSAARKESEKLKKLFEQYKEKVDDPALVDYFIKKAEWLKHPYVEGVDTAYEKTLKLLGPKLHPTQIALIEMQTLLQQSTEKLSDVVGKPEYSPLLSGLLTYGLLLIPFGISIGFMVRLKRCISLTKMTILMTLYNTIFCTLLFGLSFVVKEEEPLRSFRSHNEQSFEFVQIIISVYYVLYIGFTFLVILREALRLRCKLSVRVMLMLLIPYVVMYHYYVNVWLRAMRDQSPIITFEAWGLYGVGFTVQFLLLTCCSRKTSKSYSAESSMHQPLLDSGSSGEEESTFSKQSNIEDDHVINIDTDMMKGPEDVTDDFERVKEKVQTFAESIQTGKSIEEIETKKQKTKKKKKKKRYSTSSTNDNGQEVDENKVD